MGFSSFISKTTRECHSETNTSYSEHDVSNVTFEEDDILIPNDMEEEISKYSNADKEVHELETALDNVNTIEVSNVSTESLNKLISVNTTVQNIISRMEMSGLNINTYKVRLGIESTFSSNVNNSLKFTREGIMDALGGAKDKVAKWFKELWQKFRAWLSKNLGLFRTSSEKARKILEAVNKLKNPKVRENIEVSDAYALVRNCKTSYEQSLVSLLNAVGVIGNEIIKANKAKLGDKVPQNFNVNHTYNNTNSDNSAAQAGTQDANTVTYKNAKGKDVTLDISRFDDKTKKRIKSSFKNNPNITGELSKLINNKNTDAKTINNFINQNRKKPGKEEKEKIRSEITKDPEVKKQLAGLTPEEQDKALETITLRLEDENVSSESYFNISTEASEGFNQVKSGIGSIKSGLKQIALDAINSVKQGIKDGTVATGNKISQLGQKVADLGRSDLDKLRREHVLMNLETETNEGINKTIIKFIKNDIENALQEVAFTINRNTPTDYVPPANKIKEALNFTFSQIDKFLWKKASGYPEGVNKIINSDYYREKRLNALKDFIFKKVDEIYNRYDQNPNVRAIQGYFNHNPKLESEALETIMSLYKNIVTDTSSGNAHDIASNNLTRKTNPSKNLYEQYKEEIQNNTSTESYFSNLSLEAGNVNQNQQTPNSNFSGHVANPHEEMDNEDNGIYEFFANNQSRLNTQYNIAVTYSPTSGEDANKSYESNEVVAFVPDHNLICQGVVLSRQENNKRAKIEKLKISIKDPSIKQSLNKPSSSDLINFIKSCCNGCEKIGNFESKVSKTVDDLNKIIDTIEKFDNDQKQQNSNNAQQQDQNNTGKSDITTSAYRKLGECVKLMSSSTSMSKMLVLVAGEAFSFLVSEDSAND